jgi:hypothetical protein
MIRLSWLQFRAQAMTAAAALAAVAVILAIAGPHPVFTGTDGFLYSAAGDALFAMPPLIGIFWGAPLISRELETGTFRLAWTQSISRTRWLAAKLGLGGLASVATAGVLSLIVTWWARPIDRLYPHGSSFSYLNFDTRDLTPVGYAVFAFALGVTVGLLVRRTVPAIAITLAVFAAVQVAVPLWLRPHLFAPVTTVSALSPGSILGIGNDFAVNGNSWGVAATVNIPGAWIYSSQVVPQTGTFLGQPPAACGADGWNACLAAIAKLHLRQVATYQPASRFWEFQAAETGLYVALALVLAGFCVWRVSRRLSR